MSDVVVLSREDFDAIEFDAACSGDHRSAAERMDLLAEIGQQTEEMGRSEAYVRAGEQWLLADDPAAAARGFLRALEVGGPFSIDPRVPLARALFLLGRGAEAEAIIRQLGGEPPRDPRKCDLMAELLVEQGDLEGALTWATAGVQLCLGETPGAVSGPGRDSAPPARDSVPPARDGAAPVRDAPSAHDGASPARLGGSPNGTGRQASRDAAGRAPDPHAPHAGPGRDLTELRLLLSLRFRIRNDLGLPEDDYDRLLDEPAAESARPADTGSG